MKQCPLCGRTYAGENDFCLEDGTALMFADQMATQAYSGDTPTVVSPRFNQPPPTFQNPPQFSVPQTAPPQSSSTAKWIFPVLGLLLGAVVVLGLVVFYQFNKKDETASTNTSLSSRETPKPSESMSPSKTPTATPRETTTDSTVPGKYPEGSTRLLTTDDIAGKSDWDLRIMRNEIFARRGRKFQSPELRDYFMQQSWYRPQFNEVSISAVEQKNVDFLQNYER